MNKFFFKQIRAANVTIETGNLASIWPSGDYRVVFYTFIGREDYLNITFIGTFKTPLKETFG